MLAFRPQVETLDGRCLPSANPVHLMGKVTLTAGSFSPIAARNVELAMVDLQSVVSQRSTILQLVAEMFRPINDARTQIIGNIR